MVLQHNLETSTISFFRRLYPSLISLKELNTQQMAEIVGYTDIAASVHRDRLEKHNYLTRVNYRRWKLNPTALQHPLLTSILALNITTYIDEDGTVKATKGALPNVQLSQT